FRTVEYGCPLVIDQSRPKLTLQVVHVKSMRPVEKKAAPQSATVRVQGKFDYQGNAVHNSDGTIIGYSDMFYRWEGYHVAVNGHRYCLDFSKVPELQKLAPKLFVGGKHVLVQGDLETREDRRGEPYSAIVVSSLVVLDEGGPVAASAAVEIRGKLSKTGA